MNGNHNDVTQQTFSLRSIAARRHFLTRMSTTDLAAAITENTAATQQAVTEIQTLISEAGEDATVGSIAADLEAKLATIKANSAALAGAVPAPPAVTTPPASS